LNNTINTLVVNNFVDDDTVEHTRRGPYSLVHLLPTVTDRQDLLP